MPYSRAWTRTQKWMIVSAIIISVAALAGGVWRYERNHGEPNDSIIFGTWIDPLSVAPETSYYEFRPNHSFSVLFTMSDGKAVPVLSGRWFAGGKNIYLHYREPDQSWPLILHIVDISSTEIRVRTTQQGRIYCFTRVDPNSVPRI